MKIRFLLDENLSKQIKIATVRLNPDIDILCVERNGSKGGKTLPLPRFQLNFPLLAKTQEFLNRTLLAVWVV